MAILLDGTNGVTTPAGIVQGNLSYTGTLTGGTGVVNIGSGQVVKDASGNLLVGVASSFYGERVTIVQPTAGKNTNVQRNTSATPFGMAIEYSAISPNSTSSYFINGSDATTTRFEFRSNGGLANYSANNVNLSDERTNSNIINAGSYLAKICAIPVRIFKYKDQTDDLLNLGVIAQEVEAVAPELVDVSGFGETPEDGIPLKAIYQTDLQYALMKCIQEQQALIVSLQDTFLAQQASVSALTARLELLETK